MAASSASTLVHLGFVKDEEITALLSKQYGVPSINLAQFEVDAAVIKLIPVRDRATSTRSFRSAGRARR